MFDENEIKKKEKSRIYGALLIPAYILFLILMVFVTLVTVLKPQDNLMFKQTVLFALAVIPVSIIFFILWDRFVKDSKIILVIWIVLSLLFLALLFAISVKNSDRPGILTDYVTVLNSAHEMSNGMGLSNPEYFERYSNNIMPAVFLSLIMKAGKFVHLNEFDSCLGASLINVLLSITCTAFIFSDEEKYKWFIPGILLMITCLPVYVFTGVFYTDTMSFGLGLPAVLALKLGLKSKGFSRALLIVLAGFFTAYAFEWKATSVFVVLAFAAVYLLEKIKGKTSILLILIISAAVSIVGLKVLTNTTALSDISKDKSHPAVSWIALGMKADGSWSANRDYIDVLDSMDDKKEKQEYTYEYIKNNYKEALSADHLIQKARYNFAGGSMRSQIFLSPYESDTFLWQAMNPWGKYNWRASQFAFCWIISVYGMFLVGSVFGLINLFRGKKLPPVKVIADISFMGIIVFLMIWEANSRQLYNQIPVMIVGSVANGKYIADCIKSVFTKKRGEV